MAASFAVYLIPIASVVAIGLLLSALTRNSAAAVVGTLMTALLMQLIGILPGLGALQPYLLTTQFSAWQGFFQTPDRLDADRPRRLGLRALRGALPAGCLPDLPAPRRQRRLNPRPAAVSVRSLRARVIRRESPSGATGEEQT